MDVYGKTDVGVVRTSNQDTFFYDYLDCDIFAAFVCDGMGGENGGSVASEIMRSELKKRLKDGLRGGLEKEEVAKIIQQAYCSINSIILEKSQANVELKGMGTTVVSAVLLNNKELIISNVGDSRAYLFSDMLLKQLTTDHSYVQQLVDGGEITQEEAKVHPRRNELTKAIGIYNSISCDFNSYNVKEDDVVLICSDGLTNACDEENIRNILNLDVDSKSKVDLLISIANSRGGLDNVTAIIFKI